MKRIFKIFGGEDVEVKPLRCFCCDGYLEKKSAPIRVDVTLGARVIEGPLDELGNRQQLTVRDLKLNNLELDCDGVRVVLRGKGIEICRLCVKKLLESEPCV